MTPAVFDAYDEAIRAEYRWVPGFLYRRKRAEIQERFLARDRIYATEVWRERLERPARANLARAVARLRRAAGTAGPPPSEGAPDGPGA